MYVDLELVSLGGEERRRSVGGGEGGGDDEEGRREGGVFRIHRLIPKMDPKNT